MQQIIPKIIFFVRDCEMYTFATPPETTPVVNVKEKSILHSSLYFSLNFDLL